MEDSTLKALGERIRALRTASGMSQERLCEVAGVDRAYISQIESAQRNPSVSVVVRIADALGVEVAELLVDEKVKQSQGTHRGDSATKVFMADLAKDAEEDLNATIKRLRERGFQVTVDGFGAINVQPPQ